MIDPLAESLDRASSYGAAHPEPAIVVEPGPNPWPLDAVLRLRAAHPTVRLVAPARDAQVESLVSAFRAGADAYVVGGGDADADLAFIDQLASLQPLHAPLQKC